MDAEQFVRRVIVEVSRATGQPVRVVAGEAFAVTLWTWAELRQMHREAVVERMGERTDMAGQVAIAFHQPQDLQKMEMRYLKAAGQFSKMMESTKARLTRIAAEAAKAKPIPEA
jgi:hypothetical protein